MKRFSMVLILGLTVALTGCGRGTPGGPGATKKVETTVDRNTGETKTTTSTTATDSDATFKLKPPVLAVTVKRGERVESSIGISRGSKFDQDVTLQFENLAAGVKMDPSDPQIRRGTDEVKFFVSAAADAAPGNYTIRVKGHPATGADATADFKIKVE